MIYYFLAVLMSISSFACAHDENEQIVVRLSTENKLIPLYLGKFIDASSGVGTQYLHSLEEILAFDLNHNGMTTVIPQTSEKEKLITSNASLRGKEWEGVYYIVKVQAKNNTLSASLLAVNGSDIKTVNDIPISQQISTDRKRMHQLSDAIHKALFGTDGIATTRILYTIKKSGREHPSSEIWECDYDGENAHCIISGNSYPITPIYVPPKPGNISGSLLYVAYQSAQPKLYLASLKEKIGRRLTYLPGNQLMPAISRQRDKIAFICDVTGNPDLFLQGFDPEEGPVGKPRQIFASLRATQGTPTFHPDGNQLAFVSNKDGSPRIYVMSIPAPGVSLKAITPQLISKQNKESSAPAWSPDGTKIAYCSMTNGTRQIWIYDFTTKQERQLTQGAGNKENPSWAPNSLSLVYNSSNELYLVNCHQPKATKISSGAGEKRFPSWEVR